MNTIDKISLASNLQKQTIVGDPMNGAITPPIVMADKYSIPGVWVIPFLYHFITDITGLLLKFRETYGDVFTIKLPGYHVTYILSETNYRLIMDMTPQEVTIGPLISLLPGVGRWFARHNDDPNHLQDLVLAGNAFIASNIMQKSRFSEMQLTMEKIVKNRVERWPRQIDLNTELVDLIYEAAGCCLLGERLWSRIGHEAGDYIRKIANGFDVLNVAINSTPFYRLQPEYRATQQLDILLQKVYSEHKKSGAYEIFEAIRAVEVAGTLIHEQDIPWMVMYILSNGLSYPGTYGLWTLLDILTHRDEYQAIVHAHGQIRERLLDGCFLETTRLNPVISLARVLRKPMNIESGHKTYQIGTEEFVAVFPYLINRNPTVYQQPNEYKPLRYVNGEPLPEIFGRGRFSCGGKYFTKLLLRTIHGYLLEHLDIRLTDKLPARMSRIHLLYPTKPVRADITARQ